MQHVHDVEIKFTKVTAKLLLQPCMLKIPNVLVTNRQNVILSFRIQKFQNSKFRGHVVIVMTTY